MKAYAIFVTLFISFFYSCNFNQNANQSVRTTNSENVEISYLYNSAGNGSADINLKIFKNKTFDITINYLEEKITENYSGNIEETNNSNILYFKNYDVEVGQLFDDNYDYNNAFEVMENQNSVAINKYSEYIYIWGVYCSRL